MYVIWCEVVGFSTADFRFVGAPILGVYKVLITAGTIDDKPKDLQAKFYVGLYSACMP
jgi:predicted deacylase